MRALISCLLALPLVACVDAGDVDDEALGSTEQAIVSGSPAVDWMIERAVKPQYPCTATLVGPRHALTANHCTAYNNAGEVVHFYTAASDFDDGLVRTITRVLVPPGTASPPVVTDDYYDVDGRYADLALLELNAPAPATSVPSTLYWTYPLNGAPGLVVGAGNHDDAGTNTNALGALRYAPVVTSSADDDAGYFLVENDRTNAGDSGGPLYYYKKILGVVHGSRRYTSVPEHLPWILSQLGYTWTHGASQTGVYRAGTVMASFYEATERTCQYACDHSPCDAYDYRAATGFCVLVKDVTQVVASGAWRSDAK